MLVLHQHANCHANLPCSSPVSNACFSLLSSSWKTDVCNPLWQPLLKYIQVSLTKMANNKKNIYLFVFLRPKDAQNIEQSRGVTEMSESRHLFFFHICIICAKPTLLYSMSFLRSLFIKNVCNCLKFIVSFKSKSLFQP